MPEQQAHVWMGSTYANNFCNNCYGSNLLFTFIGKFNLEWRVNQLLMPLAVRISAAIVGHYIGFVFGQ